MSGPGAVAPPEPRALAALRHRGPDGEGSCSWSGDRTWWALGHTRLSIVDLSSSGDQPMENEDGSLVMVFNGEIYNSPELRRFCQAKGHRFRSSMDGEVILHLWEMEGLRSLARLNGIFAVAIASRATGDVYLARDPVGVKPLVYSTDVSNRLWFASELRALAAAGAPIGSHDIVALAQFLSFLWIPDPRTPFSGARSLEPGQALRWTPEGTTLLRYCEPLLPSPEMQPVGSDDEMVRDVRDRFRDAARRQLLADVPIGLMASGGVDSGLLWWATSDELGRAYTIQWPDQDDVEGLVDDLHAVKALERQLATTVTYIDGDTAETVLPPSGDLLADPAYDLTRSIASSAREHGHKVLLAGQGADELFAGYRRHRVAPLLRVRLGRAGTALERGLMRFGSSARLNAEYATRLTRALSEGDVFRGSMQLVTYSSAAERATALDCTEAEVSNDVVWARHREVFDRLPARLSNLRKVMALDLAVYLPGLGLTYMDRAGMEFGVEIRVPWLDLELVRWALTLPDAVLMRHGRGKWLTRELAARELWPELANRPKRAFSAPASRLSAYAGQGERGFRQGGYFLRARSILETYRERFPTAGRPTLTIPGL